MVLGFVLFWPAGLLILAWVLSGRHVRDLPAVARNMWAKFFGDSELHFGARRAYSDNIVFNEYQQTQFDRISEIKNEIRERAHQFATFREDRQRRRDQEEFERFMATSPNRPDREE